jgi:hypothetical protein
VRHAADFEQLEAPLEELALQEEPSPVPIETFIAADCSTPGVLVVRAHATPSIDSNQLGPDTETTGA